MCYGVVYIITYCNSIFNTKLDIEAEKNRKPIIKTKIIVHNIALMGSNNKAGPHTKKVGIYTKIYCNVRILS
jgi:hypothetical protein